MSKRVVSLLPSATELLVALGATDWLVGRSHECDWPESVTDRPMLTAQRTVATESADIDAQVRAALQGGDSLYTLDTEQLTSLAPDVILTQDLCEVCSIDLATVRGVARTMSPPPEVVSLDPKSLGDVLDDLLKVGAALGLEARAQAVRAELWARVEAVSGPQGDAAPTVAFIEWMSPLFVGGHWTPEIIERAGGRHPLNPAGAKSIVVTPDALVSLAPDFLLCAPCGYRLDQTRAEWETLTAIPGWETIPAVQSGRVALADGNALFNRPGPRLVDALEQVAQWLQTGEIPDVPEWSAPPTSG